MATAMAVDPVDLPLDALIQMDRKEKKAKAQEQKKQKERKPVPLVSQVKGISRQEIESLMLRDQEKFKPI